MTMVTKNQLIINLRVEKKKLKESLKALTDKILEWDGVHQRDKHAAPSILTDLEKILGAEE